MKQVQVWVAILATLLLCAIMPAFGRDDGMVDAVEVGVVNGNYTFTPITETPEKACPATQPATEETPYYQTREGHDEAARQVYSGDFAKKSDVVNLASKAYVQRADQGIITKIKGWIAPQIKSIGGQIQSLQEAVTGVKSDVESIKQDVRNVKKDVIKIKGDIQTLSDNDVLLSKKLSNTNGLTWLALIIAVIAIILRLRLPRFPRRPRREGPPPEEREEVERPLVVDLDTPEEVHVETPEEREARGRESLGLPTTT